MISSVPPHQRKQSKGGQKHLHVSSQVPRMNHAEVVLDREIVHENQVGPPEITARQTVSFERVVSHRAATQYAVYRTGEKYPQHVNRKESDQPVHHLVSQELPFKTWLFFRLRKEVYRHQQTAHREENLHGGWSHHISQFSQERQLELVRMGGRQHEWFISGVHEYDR